MSFVQIIDFRLSHLDQKLQALADGPPTFINLDVRQEWSA